MFKTDKERLAGTNVLPEKIALTCIPIEESLRRGTGSVLGSSVAPPAFTCSFCSSRDESDESTTAAGTGVSRSPSTGRWPREPLDRLLSDELPLVWLLRSWLSRKPSCADSVLLCTVTEIKGLELELRGGTGGGAIFLHVVMHVETIWKSVKGKHYYNTHDHTQKLHLQTFCPVHQTTHEFKSWGCLLSNNCHLECCSTAYNQCN